MLRNRWHKQCLLLIALKLSVEIWDKKKGYVSCWEIITEHKHVFQSDISLSRGRPFAMSRWYISRQLLSPLWTQDIFLSCNNSLISSFLTSFKRHFIVNIRIQIHSSTQTHRAPSNLSSQTVAMETKRRLWPIGAREVAKSPDKDSFGLRNLPLEPTARGPKQGDVFYANMAPVVHVLRTIGALPIRALPVDGRASCGE
jgi:hypothetical protein